MNESEFDRFAEEYRQLHATNIRASGESPEYFAEYKIAEIARLVRLGEIAEPSRILDFGAGIGGSVPYFRGYFPETALFCLDVSRKSLAIGRARFGEQAKFVHFDGACAPFPNGHFDFAFAACVFHHIDKREHTQILCELLRLLAPGGQLVVFEHNPLNPLTVKAVNECPFDENAVLLRAAELKSTFVASGFRQIRTRFCVFFPHSLRRLRRIEPWLSWLPIGAQYLIHARKV